MDTRLPDSLHFSLPDAMTVGMEIDMPRTQVTKAEEQQTQRSLFLGILVWFLHLNIVNALISISCKWGGLTFPVGGLSGLQLAEAIITLITVVIMLYLVYLPWRQWRSFQRAKPPANPEMLQDTEEGSPPLVASIAMLLNAFLALYIIVTFVPTFVLKACGQA